MLFQSPSYHSVNELLQLSHVLDGNVVSVVGRLLLNEGSHGLYHVDRDFWHTGTLRPSEWGTQRIIVSLDESHLKQFQPIYHRYCDNPLVRIDGYFESAYRDWRSTPVTKTLTVFQISPMIAVVH